MRNMADERRTSHSRDYRDDRNRNRGYKPSRDRDYKRNKSERKAPPEFSGKPCRVHGDKAKHTYEECRDNPKNCSRAVAITTTTTKSATMTCTTSTTNATSVAKMSLRTTIARQSRATMMDQNRATAETARSTKKITMSMLVKYLEKRGRSWSRGIFDMRSHLIPRSM